MKILLVGNRAIQHALAARLKSEGNEVFIYPGQKILGVNMLSAPELSEHSFDLIVNGSARYFFDPHVMKLVKPGVGYFGPSERVAKLETSKNEFKNFAKQFSIKTPAGETFSTAESAIGWIQTHTPPFVIKANGPARGCGVLITSDLKLAAQDINEKLSPSLADPSIVIEQFIEGFEIGINVFYDGLNYIVLPPTKPHKRRNDGDTGPLVAGMGSFAPVKLNSEFYSKLGSEILRPTLSALQSWKDQSKGCFFINLLLSKGEIYVLEYNCRMGDPAMLVDIMMLKSSLTTLLKQSVDQELSKATPQFSTGYAAAVALVLPAYPIEDPTVIDSLVNVDKIWNGKSDSGFVISAGSYDGQHLTNNGGVVAFALASQDSTAKAIAKAYEVANELRLLDRRTDIAKNIQAPAEFAD